VALSDAGEVFFEGDIEDPVEGVFDLPMGAHGRGGLFGAERPGRDVVTVFPGAEVFVLDAGLDPDQGGDFGEAVLAGEAPASGHPVDGLGDVAAALLDAAVALVALDVGVEGLWGWVIEEALDFAMERGLVVLNGQEIVGLLVDDAPGDRGVAGDRVDGDQRAGQRPGGGQALQEQRDRGGFVRLLLDRLLAEHELLAGRKGRDQMQRGLARGPVVAAPRGLTVQRDELRRILAQRARPGHEAGREQLGVDAVHQDIEPTPAGQAMVKRQKTAQKVQMSLAPGGNVIEIIARRNRPADNKQQDLRQGMGHPPLLARVLDNRKMIQKARKASLGKGCVHGGDSEIVDQSQNESHPNPDRQTIRPLSLT
jgi:hypothetical protein